MLPYSHSLLALTVAEPMLACACVLRLSDKHSVAGISMGHSFTIYRQQLLQQCLQVCDLLHMLHGSFAAHAYL